MHYISANVTLYVAPPTVLNYTNSAINDVFLFFVDLPTILDRHWPPATRFSYIVSNSGLLQDDKQTWVNNIASSVSHRTQLAQFHLSQPQLH